MTRLGANKHLEQTGYLSKTDYITLAIIFIFFVACVTYGITLII